MKYIYNHDHDDASSSVMRWKNKKNVSRPAQRQEGTKQNGHRQSSRRVREIDTRGDDSYSPSLNLRDDEADCRDGPKVAQSRISRMISDGNDSSRGRGRKTRRDDKKKQEKDQAVPVASTTKSQDHAIPDSMAYWTFLSVRSAMAVMQADGSDTLAEEVANAVLDARRPSSTLRTLATEMSLVVLKGKGDLKVAAALTEAIVNNKYETSLTPKPSMETDGNASGGITNDSYPSKNSLGDTSVTPSIESTLMRLKEREDEIAKKTKALEEAEQLNKQKETEFKEEWAKAELLKSNTEDAEASLANARHLHPDIKSASQEVSTVITLLSEKRRKLKEKEHEIDKMTRALEEAEQLTRQRERKIKTQTNKAQRFKNEQLGNSTERSSSNGPKHKRHHGIDDDDASFASHSISSLFTSMTTKQNQLKEKEDEIAQKNKALDEAAQAYRRKEKEILEQMEEAARLNLQREKEISERMAALDAKEAALRETVHRERATFGDSQAGKAFLTNTGSESLQINPRSPKKALQLPQTERTSVLGDLTGRLSSFLDSNGQDNVPWWQIGARSPASDVEPNMGLTHAIHESYSTHASDSTSLVTNKTGLSKAITATSAITDDHRTWETTVSALTEDTGLMHRQADKNQNKCMLNRALYDAMNQYSSQPANMTANTLRPIAEPSSEQLSTSIDLSRQSSSRHSSINQSLSKSSMGKLKRGFFSFSAKTPRQNRSSSHRHEFSEC